MNSCFNISFVTLFACVSLASAEPVSFKSDIAPILLAKCQSCHGPKKAKGRYRVDTFDRAIKAGAKEIHYRVSTDDEFDVMPPKGERLTQAQTKLFKQWMDQGAKFDGTDPHASLASITPGVTHPDPPKSYARPIPITALAFAADSDHLIVGGYRELLVWEVESGELTRRIRNMPERVHAVDVNKDGSLIAVAGGIPGRLGEVRIIDADSGDVIKTIHKSEDLCFSARFSPDGSRLVTGGADGTVRVFSTSTWLAEIVFTNHSDWVIQVAWSYDGTKVASAGRDRTAKVYDIALRKRITSYTGHAETIYAIHFHPDVPDMFTGAADGRLMRWRINDGGTVREYVRFDEAIYQIADMHTHKRLVTAGGKPFTMSMDWHNPARQQAFQAGPSTSLSVAAGRDGRWLASGDRLGNVRVWDVKTGELKVQFPAKP